jgi:hypothetical protein
MPEVLINWSDVFAALAGLLPGTEGCALVMRLMNLFLVILRVGIDFRELTHVA